MKTMWPNTDPYPSYVATISKTLERIMYDKIIIFISNFIFQFGFMKDCMINLPCSKC